MKILLYTGYRTGSNSFGEWLSIQLNIPYYHEPFNSYIKPFNENFSIETSGDCIIKISPADGFDYKNLKKLFDKKIVLYRENTKEQAESTIWANEKQMWHHRYSNDKFINAHYTITKEWILTNALEIKNLQDFLEKEKEELKLLKDCVLITYEELYYSEDGIKKIEDYLGFKSNSKFNKMDKLRNGFFKKSLT